jgi:hypothetical protein
MPDFDRKGPVACRMPYKGLPTLSLEPLIGQRTGEVISAPETCRADTDQVSARQRWENSTTSSC